MRELERDLPPATATPAASAAPSYLAIVGSGRAGTAIARAARASGIEVDVLGREDGPAIPGGERSAVLLCVPDEAIAAACRRITPFVAAGTSVGHVSGATPIAALEAAADAGQPTFSMHPMQTIPDAGADLAGAPCGVCGSSREALDLARDLATAIGMRPFDVADEHRAAYHAAASMASNFLVTLEESAAGLLDAAGVAHARDVLAPLVLRTAANWAERGSEALTGPIARGDDATVARHLAALEADAPELLPLYEALAERTRALAARQRGSS